MKDAIRQKLLTQRLALSVKEVERFSQSLIEKIQQLSIYKSAKHVGIYSPIKNEPNLFPLMQDHKQFYLPKVVGDTLIYLPWNGKDTLVKSALGILEPTGVNKKNPILDLLIIPGIGFDRKGNRIGFGKGFFDSFLNEHRPKVVIGVAFPFQMLASIQVTDFDQMVDQVIVA
jgi:5-formyltetrahydrofolate cyclo-ligase